VHRSFNPPSVERLLDDDNNLLGKDALANACKAEVVGVTGDAGDPVGRTALASFAASAALSSS
jgi:hypothetical protein